MTPPRSSPAVRSSAQERSYVLMEIYGKDAATQRAYIERLDSEHNLFLVATVNEQIVGILALLDFLVCSTPGPCLNVGVHVVRDWRGRGLGSAMLRYALRWAKEHEYRRLEADIFTTNERSVHLFDKAGFREVIGPAPLGSGRCPADQRNHPGQNPELARA